MNCPYKGKFRVSQEYKGTAHKGIDLVAIDDNKVYCTVDGKIIRAGWENPNNRKQGWGLRVVVKENGTNRYFYFGHLSKICEYAGDVKKGDIIGVQGNTGHSTGDHLHYECRENDNKANYLNICDISEIPNFRGTYISNSNIYDVKWLQNELNKRGYNLVVDGICGAKTTAAIIDCLEKNKW